MVEGYGADGGNAIEGRKNKQRGRIISFLRPILAEIGNVLTLPPDHCHGYFFTAT